MGRKSDGGPAFPNLGFGESINAWTEESGMSLRDVFAVIAMPLCMAETAPGRAGDFNPIRLTAAASAAYRLADVMLLAREVDRG